MAVRNPLVTQAFALAGDRTLPPVAAQANGSVSFNQGWPALYQADPNTDPNARPVERDIMNAMLWLLTSNLQQYQREGVPEFIPAAENAGVAVAYPAGVSVLWRATTGDPFHTYVNTLEGNTNAPPHSSWIDMSNIAANVLLRSGGTMNAGADILLNTPPQFDNDRSAASTAFVQRALGNYQGTIFSTTGGTLNVLPADAGKLVILSGASVTGVCALPALSDVLEGSAYTVKVEAATSNWTVQANAANPNSIILGNSSVSSVALGRGESLVFVKNGSFWRTAGTGELRFSDQFAQSLTGNGFKKLPGGFLMQWGGVSGFASYTVTFPIAFPNTPVCLLAGNNGTAGNISATCAYINNTSFGLYQSTSGSAYWLAIGY